MNDSFNPGDVFAVEPLSNTAGPGIALVGQYTLTSQVPNQQLDATVSYDVSTLDGAQFDSLLAFGYAADDGTAVSEDIIFTSPCHAILSGDASGETGCPTPPSSSIGVSQDFLISTQPFSPTPFDTGYVGPVQNYLFTAPTPEPETVVAVSIGILLLLTRSCSPWCSRSIRRTI